MREVPARCSAVAECTSGRGPKCEGLEDRADAARRRVAEAGTELVRLGSGIVEDRAAKRLAAFLPVSEGTIGLATPLILPVWLELSGWSSHSRAGTPPQGAREAQQGQEEAADTSKAAGLQRRWFPFKKASA